MKSALVGTLKASVTLVLFYLLFRKVDSKEFLSILGSARIGTLIWAFVVLWVGHYICIYRWRMLMKPVMPVQSSAQLFAIYCIGLFFNLAFPTTVGGDIVKGYYAGKPSRRFASSFAATFLDRDAGMFAMMIIACAASIMSPIQLPSVPLWFIIWSAFFAFTLINIAVFTPGLHRRLTDILKRFHMSQAATKIDAISEVFLLLGKHRPALAGSMLISFINQLLVIAVTWIMAGALNIREPLTNFLMIVPAVTLISMIPISLNGMGLREYGFVALLGGIGVDREAAAALGIISSVFVFLSAIPGGIIYIFFRTRADVERMAVVESDLA